MIEFKISDRRLEISTTKSKPKQKKTLHVRHSTGGEWLRVKNMGMDDFKSSIEANDYIHIYMSRFMQGVQAKSLIKWKTEIS